MTSSRDSLLTTWFLPTSIRTDVTRMHVSIALITVLQSSNVLLPSILGDEGTIQRYRKSETTRCRLEGFRVRGWPARDATPTKSGTVNSMDGEIWRSVLDGVRVSVMPPIQARRLSRHHVFTPLWQYLFQLYEIEIWIGIVIPWSAREWWCQLIARQRLCQWTSFPVLW